MEQPTQAEKINEQVSPERTAAERVSDAKVIQVLLEHISLRDQRIHLLQENLKSIKSELEQLKRTYQHQTEATDHDHDQLAGLAEQNQQLQARANRLQAELDELQANHQQNLAYEAQIQSLQEQLKVLEQASSVLTHQAGDLIREKAVLTNQVDHLNREKTVLQEQVNHHTQVRKGFGDQIELLNLEKANLQRNLEERQAELTRIQSSRIWRLILFIWKLRQVVAPNGSRRAQLGGKVYRGMVVLKNEGLGSFTRGVLRQVGFFKARSPEASPAVVEEAAPVAEPAALQVVQPIPAAAPGVVLQNLVIYPQVSPEELRDCFEQAPLPEKSFLADIVCFPVLDWNFRYQRPQQLMSQFASHGHRVFYISISRFQPADPAAAIEVKLVKPNIYEVILRVSRTLNIYQEVFASAVLAELVTALKELRSRYQMNDALSFVMMASWTEAALQAKDLWGWKVIYDCMDEWENMPLLKPEVIAAERRLVRQADLVVVTAQKLMDKWKDSSKNIILARNGVDYDFYRRNLIPNSLLAGVKHPLVGYFGAVAEWMDFELVAYAAIQRPEYTFVLVGAVSADVSLIHDLPNVILLGQQPYEDMPRYLFHFDVCTIPFLKNPVTEATDPVKLYEYLSAGKPVVSVRLHEVEAFEQYVYLADSKEAFVEKLDAALKENDPTVWDDRIRFAQSHTWQNRYEKISRAIAQSFPKVSIIIVTWNGVEITRLCFDSLIRNTVYPNYEIIFVDNASSDGSVPYLRYLASRFDHVKVILNDRNQGFAKANNQGLSAAEGEYYVLLNNDVIVPPGWLSRLLKYLQDPQVGMVGPVTSFAGNEALVDIPYHTLAEMESFASQTAWEYENQAGDIGVLAMYCVAMRREVYQQIGPLDERFGAGMFEDDDYAVRARECGLRLLCARDAFIHHFGKASFNKLIQNNTYDQLFETNREIFEKKWQKKWVPHVYGEFELNYRFLPEKKVPDGFLIGKDREIATPPSQSLSRLNRTMILCCHSAKWPCDPVPLSLRDVSITPMALSKLGMTRRG